MIITVKNQFFIAWAWGPRRATSRKRYGAVESLYPSAVTASHKLWLSWLMRGTKDWLFDNVAIVTPHRKATARVKNAIKDIPVEVNKSADSDEIAALMAKRQELRAEKKFAEADEIRDRLQSLGVAVKDGKI